MGDREAGLSQARSWRRVVGGLVALVVAGGLGWFLLLQVIFSLLEPAPMAPLAEAEGLASLSAETCRTCHPDQYEEWRGSMMGQAFVDPVFVQDYQHQGEPFVCPERAIYNLDHHENCERAITLGSWGCGACLRSRALAGPGPGSTPPSSPRA